MDSFGIAISGLEAAQKAFGVIGNNIANAATEGYHCQTLNLVPSYTSQVGTVLIGGGVDVAEITRSIDSLLENEILRQYSSLGKLSQETDTLRTIETAFGELSSGSSLSKAIDDFFNSLQDLATYPDESVWQQQVVAAAETMANQFKTMEDLLENLKDQITLEAEQTIGEINTLISTIAELNDSIERLEIGGGQANNLRDQRDQCIAELSELIDVQTQSRDFGVIDVSIAGIPVVTGVSSVGLEVGYRQESVLGVTVAGESNYQTEVQGGKLGGLLSLNNEIIADIQNDLNTLAGAIIQQVNQYHIQGVGSEGSFTQLTGWSMVSGDLADIEPPLTDGTVYVRVIDTATGEITRTAISIDVSADSLTTIAADISAVTGLAASVSGSVLSIQADAGYEFDFLPSVLPSPTDSDFSGATSPPDVSVSGIYTGNENQTFTFTVSGSGSVGNGTLSITVTDGHSNVVATLDVGSGYAGGDFFDLDNGIKIALGTGDLVDGNTFEVEAFAETDTSGFLAAVGINTFFSGTDASTIAVCSDISDSPGRIAAALGADMTDNSNVLRLAGLADQAMADLDSLSPAEFYRKFITDIGLELSVKQTRQENTEAIIKNLAEQQSEISGVDINSEAAQMLIYEQMFQAMAKYLDTVQSSLTTLMELL
ncbi:MAG: flagellar hook-associated protein FlgK [Sedimentisphaerales bacterium]|nr:flagellar hook-associated protein FlgK [Sedimentisphaerales bacterium]